MRPSLTFTTFLFRDLSELHSSRTRDRGVDCGGIEHTKFPNGVNLKAQMQGYYLRESNLTTLLATETISVLQDIITMRNPSVVSPYYFIDA